MSTYTSLSHYLSHVSTNTHPMTFAEIEKIIGRPLPPSAYKHRPWWSNNVTNSAMTRAWIEAGWKSERVDMEGRTLVFRRVNPPSPSSRSPSSFMPPDSPKLGHTLQIDLTSETIENLQIKAEAADLTVEQVAAALIAAHAKPSLQERLAIADRIRSQGPSWHDVDLPALIREDRDSR